MSSLVAESVPELLHASGLAAGYGPLQILWDVELAIGERECVMLLGPNGAGKTTLLKTLLGLIPLQRGSIRFQGRSLVGLRTDERVRRGIAYMSEMGVFPNLSVDENLELGGYYLRRNEARQRATEMYQSFPDLALRRGASASSLSGGQRKMLGLAKAFMNWPKLLIMDEPSAGLSPRYVKEVVAALQRFQDEGLAMLIAEQNLGFLTLATRVYVLDGGRISFSGSVAALHENDVLRRSYFGLGNARHVPV